MNLYESIKSNLIESDDTLKQLIKDEFGFDVKYLDYNSSEFAKHGNLNDFIRRCLKEAKAIGLDVDEVVFGYPGVGDNYVGNRESKIVITDDASNADSTLLRKELPTDENALDVISRSVLDKPISVSDAGNVFMDNGDYLIQGIIDENVYLYYLGKDRKSALSLMQSIKSSLNEADGVDDKQQVLNDFAEEIDLTPLYDKLRQMSGISGLEFTSKVDVSPAHIEIQSVSVLDACGVFKLGLQDCVFETFNSRIKFLEDSDVPYWWGTIDLRYSNKRGGTNGIEVLRFSYNEEPGKWSFDGED